MLLMSFHIVGIDIQYLLIMMKALLRTFNKFGTLNEQYIANKSRNAVRFQSQNILWDFDEVNFQSVALSKGLTSLNFQKNDNFLIRLPSSQQTEAYIAKLGTAGISANLIVSRATTVAEVDNQLKSNNIKGIIFEPTLPLSSPGEQFIDVLNELIPELSKTGNGARVKSAQYPSLSALIQTNFYSYPGVFKFRSILNYAEDKYYKIPYDAQFQAIALPESSNTIFITESASDFAFRAGVLNSNLNGRYVVVVEPSKVSKIADYHNGKVDLIATEPIVNVPEEINVYVQKGSELLKDHPKRVEL